MIHCTVPLERLGDGWYIFGTRRIFARIAAGKLAVRVGGGWMSIKEFIETHSEEELHKLERMKASGRDVHSGVQHKDHITNNRTR